ncbi:MAG: hypothetical protein IKU43_08095 [Clostridia bacterium]|nr:hypothetical protein [Clostridia bacterium]
MERLTEKYRAYLTAQQDMMRDRIRNTKTNVKFKGKAYYVSNEGNDNNDGLTPETSWLTLEKVSTTELCEGDAVFLKRGQIFRGQIICQPGVTYSAYGEGNKPEIYGWYENFAGADNWECINEEKHLWRLKKEIPDTGTLVFNEGEAHAIKLVPSYVNGKFVVRDKHDVDFDIEKEATVNLAFHQACTKELINGVPLISPACTNTGYVILRCDEGNPGAIYNSIEILPKRNTIACAGKKNITIDNLCIKYCGAHGVGSGTTEGLTVQNCEFGWIGGAIQHYNHGNPNRIGYVTRYGNGVEIYGGCKDYTVDNCYFYQVYDAAITHQTDATGRHQEMINVKYTNNLIETSTYSIEYFLSFSDIGTNKSIMKDFYIGKNFMVDAGCGWGKQRYNPETPAHIKSWNSQNPCINYVVENNVFFYSTHDLLQVGCLNKEGVPVMRNNVYIQKLGGSFGNVGVNPPQPRQVYADAREYTIKLGLGDTNAEVFYID